MVYIKTAEGWKVWVAAHKVCDNHNKLEGVFRNMSYDDVVSENSARADRFIHELEHNPRGRFSEPLYGAYGEKL